MAVWSSLQHFFVRNWQCLLLLAVCWYQLVESLLFLSPFDDIPFDGPFQLFNWLRRIDHGQLPGRDFNCFHGLGIPYIHYPLYKLMGGGILGSEFSRQVMSRFAMIATYLIISRIITKKYTLGIAWLSFTMLPAINDLGIGPLNAVLDATIFKVAECGDPKLSSVGLRGLLPLLFLSCFYLPSTPRVAGQNRFIGAVLFF